MSKHRIKELLLAVQDAKSTEVDAPLRELKKLSERSHSNRKLIIKGLRQVAPEPSVRTEDALL